MNMIIGVAGGNLPTWMVKAFPVETRFTAIAVGYNAAQVLPTTQPSTLQPRSHKIKASSAMYPDLGYLYRHSLVGQQAS